MTLETYRIHQVFIDEECDNLILVHINQKKKSDVLQSLRGVHSAKNVVVESIIQ